MNYSKMEGVIRVIEQGEIFLWRNSVSCIQKQSPKDGWYFTSFLYVDVKKETH
jgi:hypothetical protein